ncbi:MAG TPA: hypothetical protein VEY95_17515 [Azospirillaceae bacterium]|nr:hypothetical protein [Azospirillaceae bacterium]
MRTLAAAMAALALSAGSAAAQIDLRFNLGADGPCLDTARAALARNGVAAADIRVIYDMPRYAGSSQVLQGWDVWARLHSCDGAVVVSTLENCYIQQVYARGGCRVTGVR